ncbi:MAG: hydroxyacid dehydrogenase, partial [Oscillospiraceae bacterium]|nr:hydroxyacid dehydrogenase [Oscillospiraceae bacterium]
MKVLHIGKKGNMERYSAPESYLSRVETADAYMGLSTEEYLALAGDAEVIVADAVASVPAALMDGMPRLRLIHSEGVAYNGINLQAARERGIYVCNCQGANARAVAEQTVLLMLGMLRNVTANDRAVREGRQIAVKEGYMLRGDLRELADCAVGLVGFGSIARSTAALLRAHGVERIYYYKRSPLSPQEEEQLGVQ